MTLVQQLLAEAHARCRHFAGDATRDELVSALEKYAEVRTIGKRLDNNLRKSVEAAVQGSLGNVHHALTKML